MTLLALVITVHAQNVGGSGKGDTYGVILQTKTNSNYSGPASFILSSQTSFAVSTSFTLTVQLKDSFGNILPYADSSITLAASQAPPGGVLSGTTSAKLLNSTASFPISVNVAGSYTLTLSYPGLPDTSIQTLAIVPTRLVVIAQPAAAVYITSIFMIQVQFQDALGNAGGGLTNTVSIALESFPVGAVLSGTTSLSAVNGIATFNLSANTFGTYTFRISSAGFPDVISAPVIIRSLYLGGSGKGDASWRGVYFLGTTSDLSLASNWSSGIFPASGDAVIPATALNQPVVSSAVTVPESVRMSVESGASLTVNPGAVLTVNGTLTVRNNATMLVRSNATGDGSIGNSSGQIVGSAIVQLFVPAIANPSPANGYGRRWRFISSPVQSTTFDDLQNEVFITGRGNGKTVGSINSNGFDATANNEPSVYRYAESTSGGMNSGWEAIAHIDSAMTQGRGYRLFIRGDRSDTSRIGVNNAITPQNQVTLDYRGSLNQGTVPLPVTYTNTGSAVDDGWNLVGNPFACKLDWNALHDDGRTGSGPDYSGASYTNLEPNIWTYDPVTNSYSTFNALTNIGGITGGIIAAGQSFLVKSRTANPSLLAKEQYKTTNSGVRYFKNELEFIRIELFSDSNNRDELFISYHDSARITKDQYDASKFMTPLSIAAFDSDSQMLAISTRPSFEQLDTVRLNIKVPSAGSYLLYVSKTIPHVRSILLDHQTGKSYHITDGFKFPFSVSEVSEVQRRFSIVNADMATSLDESITSATSSQLFIYPNPADDRISILNAYGEYVHTLRIYTLTGALIKEIALNETEQTVTITWLPAGLYAVQLKSSTGSTTTHQLLKP